MKVKIEISKKQYAFMKATEDEVLYGGAAGGGKTYGQVIDAFYKAMAYPGIKQLILRNSHPELNRSVIPLAISIIPRGLYKYSGTAHLMTFNNSSTLEFGYLSSDTDVTQYQSAEYDIIRFDELTHFSAYQYDYMKSRLRGANDFPKQMKSTTNPGSRGHNWVKERFIDSGLPNKKMMIGEGSARFIPALVTENLFLMKKDKKYIKRLESLPDNERKALLYGDWNIYEGQFFSEFINDPAHYSDRLFTHVIEPFCPNENWEILRSFDFGYSKPFSVGWWAIDYDGRLYRIHELYGAKKDAGGRTMANVGLKLSPAEIFPLIKEVEESHPYLKGKEIWGVADPAIFDKSRGESIAETGEKYGIYFNRGDNKRIAGWMQMRNRLRFDDKGRAMLYVFSTCREFIRTVPSLLYGKLNPEDLDTTGEDHIADEVRYLCMEKPFDLENYI